MAGCERRDPGARPAAVAVTSDHRQRDVRTSRPRALLRAAAATLALTLAACADAEDAPPPAPGATLDLGQRANAPLLIALHGPEGSGARLKRLAAFTIGDEGWSIAYPDSGRAGWMGDEIDQVARLSDLIGRLARSGLVDPSRVFVAGLSGGGQLALRLACERPDLVAGVAAVAASLPQGADCRGEPVPVLLIHATTDPVLPFGGGAVRPPALPSDLARVALASPVMAAEETAALLSRRNRCAAARTVSLPDLAPEDGTTAIQRTYEGCAAATSQIVIEGGGHGWPGTRLNAELATAFGQPGRDVSATLEIEAFFREAPALAR